MKRHLLFLVLSAVLVSTYSYEIVLQRFSDGEMVPVGVISEDMDSTKTTEAAMDNSVPVLSEPESMMSTMPMKAEVAVDSLATETMEVPVKVLPEEAVAKKDEVTGRASYDVSATDMLRNIYSDCIQHGSFACVKPKMLSFLSYAAKKDKIFLTEDLIIEKNGRDMSDGYQFEQPQQFDGSNSVRADVLLEKIDSFLSNHELKLRVPKEIVSGELLPYVPKFLLQNIPAELRVPLSETKSVGQERGIIKKVVIPFLLGLKFKATALIPLALALIALKTWKALTLGLLSIVLSGAMVIFKFTKPKVVNYEVYHYPAATPAVVEHPAPAYEHHGGWSRSLDAQPLAYRAYAKAYAKA